MNRMFTRRTPNNHHKESLSPDKRKMINEASLEALKRVYAKCCEEGIPKNALIDAIETEIFRKTFNKNTMKIERIYKLEKFISKKKG